jgi:type VI protein secretion system component VasF
MARERSELEQRRSELTQSLTELSDDKDRTYRQNSDAIARDRAGVKHEEPEEMVRLGGAQVAADDALRKVQRELREIDAELAAMPRPRLGARIGRAFRGGGATLKADTER